MAISETHYRLLRELRNAGELPKGFAILEIGEANWYGDMSLHDLMADIATIETSDALVAAVKRLDEIRKAGNCEDCAFEIAKLVYQVLMEPQRVEAIDANGPTAQKHDLNTLIAGSGDCAFNLTINHGTAEHVFNIANVFRVMHDATISGGLMIHESPFTGWIDHGFYCLQPTLFYDVAAANGYEVVMVAIEHLASKSVIKSGCREEIHDLARRDMLPNNAMLFVVLRKGADGPFRVPMQGVYSGSVSPEAQQAWRELR